MSDQDPETLWARVWDTLDLPKPRFRHFDDRWQWLRWGEWQAYRRRRGDSLVPLAYWQLLDRPGADQALANSEFSPRFDRWLELEARARRREPAVFPEVVALRALDFLREIEQRYREGGTPEQLAVCLSIQVALLGGSLGLEEEAQQLFEESWALGEREEGWRVSAAV